MEIHFVMQQPVSICVQYTMHKYYTQPQQQNAKSIIYTCRGKHACMIYFAHKILIKFTCECDIVTIGWDMENVMLYMVCNIEPEF